MGKITSKKSPKCFEIVPMPPKAMRYLIMALDDSYLTLQRLGENVVAMV